MNELFMIDFDDMTVIRTNPNTYRCITMDDLTRVLAEL